MDWLHVLTVDVAGFVEALAERGDTTRASGDPPWTNPTTGIADCCARTASGHVTALPSSADLTKHVCTIRRVAHKRDELAAPHSMISSASNCRELGTSRPSALAVCMLMTNSHLVDCKTGKSAGFAPLRI